ncbi:beta-amyrin 11-oxidase-like [Durio zibethinus]|uniref:Beta-amyrin 11-oxidase-like n=1 Tax=Durio zibethinus TaxID=66656 RepID=A0A6P6BIX7_DURZI|nr:beta-amyrin 11-oxidase-like [Durio zibethinus]
MKTKNMELDFLWLILAVLVGAYVFLFGFLKKINEWYYVFPLGKMQNSLPPGDMGWPFIGNMWSFLKAFRSKDPDTFINNLVERYGRTGIYKSYLFGSPSIIVCIPETCKKVLTDERFAPGYPVSVKKLLGSKSFHGVSHLEHRRLRKLTTAPINGHEALAIYIGYIVDIVISALEEWASMNRPIEFLKEMEKVTFMVFTHIFIGSGAESIRESMKKYHNDFHHGLLSAAYNIPGFPFHKALKARNMLVKIFHDVLDERRTRAKSDDPNEKRGMIDLLMEIEDENGDKFSDTDIIDLLLTFLSAGFGSTANAATWTTIYLHDHPEILQKAKEEQEEILKRRPSAQKGLNLMDIRQMEYLAKVIDETLRKSNPAFSNFRVAQDDVNIDGYFIPKGWKVLVWTRGVHMDPETYVNPKEFLPTRWDNQKAKAGSFLPFGGGSRICPGADLAKLQLSIFLHYFLLNCKLEQINPGGPIVYLPVPRPLDNCLAKVIKLP